MVQTIVKTFYGSYIDLSKVVSISDAYFTYRGSGKYRVCLDIHVQLMDKPIELEFGFIEGIDYKILKEPRNGSYFEVVNVEGTNTPVAVKRIQDEVDKLVEHWKQVTMELHISKKD